MKVLELFCGTKSISKAFQRAGHETFTVDIDSQFKPDLCKDIMELSIDDIPFKPDVIWASPPCTTFSVASIARYWDNGLPKNGKAIIGRALLYKTLWFIETIKPKYWFIENPRGMMRKEGALVYLQNINSFRHTVTYCQYGDKRQKPTDIWTNCNKWKSRPPCNPGDSCHDQQPRTYEKKKEKEVLSKGTQGLKDAIERSMIPDALCDEIVKVVDTLGGV